MSFIRKLKKKQLWNHLVKCHNNYENSRLLKDAAVILVPPDENLSCGPQRFYQQHSVLLRYCLVFAQHIVQIPANIFICLILCKYFKNWLCVSTKIERRSVGKTGDVLYWILIKKKTQNVARIYGNNQIRLTYLLAFIMISILFRTNKDDKLIF